MAHEPSDDDQYACTCGAERVPDGDGGTVCRTEDFTEVWPDFTLSADAPTNDAVAKMRSAS